MDSPCPSKSTGQRAWSQAMRATSKSLRASWLALSADLTHTGSADGSALLTRSSVASMEALVKPVP